MAGRNVISLSETHGVYISGDLNTVEGNLIGTDPSGTIRRGNGGLYAGIYINNAEQNMIGGLDANSGNVISGNGYGVHIFGNGDGTLQENEIYANYIGVRPRG